MILQREFEYKLKSHPIRIGSTEKGTAIKNKYNIDICLAFRSEIFSSTKKMFDAVYLMLPNNMGKYSITDVRDQSKSIGVFFNIGGELFKVDVVPYKISRSRRNKTEGYLYKSNTSFFGNNTSYTKTDISCLEKSKTYRNSKKNYCSTEALEN